MIIDTHCHLDFESFDDDRDAVVQRAIDAGVERIIVPALDLENCPKVLRLAERYKSVFAAVGIHPNSTKQWNDSWIEKLRDFAAHPRVVAIGEIGLDDYWDKSPKETQRHAFAAQISLAAELDLPIIVHNRETDREIVDMLRASGGNRRANPGVVHSFFSGWEVAEELLSLGFYLGFTGPVTFKKANNLRRVPARMPLDRILVETDAPFLAPQPHRGKRNEPAYVAHIVEQLAELRDKSKEEMATITTHNAVRLFSRMEADQS